MPDLAKKIRAALDEYDREADAEQLEERLGRIEESAGRAFTKDELKAIFAELDDDDRDELVEALIGPERYARVREGDGAGNGAGGSQEPVGGDGGGNPPARRTRPGRKSGMAYDWDVDDEGNVVDLELARVYEGDDEDDEVELPAEVA